MSSKRKSRGRRRHRRKGDVTDGDKRERSSSSRRRYDWNSEHFFPDIHDSLASSRPAITVRAATGRRRFCDYIEEGWIEEQMKLKEQQQKQQQQQQQQQQQEASLDQRDEPPRVMETSFDVMESSDVEIVVKCQVGAKFPEFSVLF